MKKFLFLNAILLNALSSSCITLPNEQSNTSPVKVYGQTLENNIQMSVNETIIITLPIDGFAGPDYTWQLGVLSADPIVKLEMNAEVGEMQEFTLKAIKKGSIKLRFSRWNETYFYCVEVV